MPIPFETARERDARIFADVEAAKAEARAELGIYPLRRFRHRMTGDVTEMLAKPGAVEGFFEQHVRADFEEVGGPAGTVEMVEQHWGQA